MALQYFYCSYHNQIPSHPRISSIPKAFEVSKLPRVRQFVHIYWIRSTILPFPDPQLIKRLYLPIWEQILNLEPHAHKKYLELRNFASSRRCRYSFQSAIVGDPTTAKYMSSLISMSWLRISSKTSFPSRSTRRLQQWKEKRLLSTQHENTQLLLFDKGSTHDTGNWVLAYDMDGENDDDLLFK